VSTATDGERVFVGDDDALVGLARDGGVEEWRIESGPTRPITAGSGVVVAREAVTDAPDRFAGIEGGEEAWSYDPPMPVVTTDHDGESLFVALEDRVAAITLADGTVEWTLETGRTAANSAVGSGDLAVVGVGGRVVATNRESGAVQWVNPIASALQVVAGTEELTVALSEEPAVYVIDGDGVVVRETRLANASDLAFPRPGDTAGGNAYVAAAGVVTAFASDGTERWSRSLGGSANSLGVDAGALFALDGGTLYRLPAAVPDDAPETPTGNAGFNLGIVPLVLAVVAAVIGGGSALAYYVGLRDRE
jgi:outer membrane protein assembly factor BamB